MEISIRELTDKMEILNACRTTVWKDDLEKEPTAKFMDNIYMSEHSPIRERWFTIKILGIPSWVATHFARHSLGYTPYVSTQRDDRIDYEGTRDDRKQGELVNMRITLNSQSFINVSKVRLCNQAHIEAQKTWNVILSKLDELDHELVTKCVPACIYRGFCPELTCCGRVRTDKYKLWRKEYIGDREVI